MKHKIVAVFLVLAVIASCYAASVLNYNEQGGARDVIGGSLDVVSGGDLDIESGGALKLAGTAITSTAAELNVMDGVTATASELNVTDGATAGTAVASKAMVLDANKDIETLRNLGLISAIFEGTTADTAEITFTSADPTLDRTQTLPDYTGGVPLAIGQGFTQSTIDDTTAVDITGSSLTLADGWMTAGKALKWTLTGTKTGANGTLIIYLYLDDAIQCTLTSGGNTAGDWQAEIIMFEHTDTANQTITGRLIAADGAVTDFDTDTTDMNDGGTTVVKCQVDLGHTDDAATVDAVLINHWVK